MAGQLTQAGILLVDDREENLLALEAILAPLGHRLVRAASGEDALRELLRQEVACILLDVDMPGMDGFETARLIKERERTKHIPIVFVTALPDDDRRVFHGYSAGAVDYIVKPIDPVVLRSKVEVFTDLWQKSRQLREQERLLHEQELLALERASETRYRNLADAMPQIVWRGDVDGNATYFNRRWFEYTGMSASEADAVPWAEVVHREDLERLLRALRSSDSFELEFRIRGADGRYRWHLARTAPVTGARGQVESWVGTATDIHDRKVVEEQWSFLLDAGDALARSLDYRRTLSEVADMAASSIADWCVVSLVDERGELSTVALAHQDPRRSALARELEERYPTDGQSGVAGVIAAGEAALVTEITDETLRLAAADDLHFELLKQLELRSYMCVPFLGREQVLGAIAFVSTEPTRLYERTDLRLAEELARRATAAIENSLLYRRAEERAQAARVLDAIGDGVVLVDSERRVRLWNPAAGRITGIAAESVLGRPIELAVPGWHEVANRLVVGGPSVLPEVLNVPLDLGDREVWLSISGVGLDEGVVYAFRDLTEEQRLETMRQDLVATVSHELRTPLAAIFGAALTMQRPDDQIGDSLRGTLVTLIADEASRLSSTVDDLLLASRLDAGKLAIAVEPCDPLAIARAEVEAARLHASEAIAIELAAPEEPALVSADPGQLRQVLANLLDNAIKYSPDGGRVTVGVRADNGIVRLEVADQGIGIPADERRRIFEKFYRLDPEMARGVGGTGLGLYICRELVRRVDGRIWVEANGARGSRFVVELQQARGPAPAELSPAGRAVSPS